eukprot:356245_1
MSTSVYLETIFVFELLRALRMFTLKHELIRMDPHVGTEHTCKLKSVPTRRTYERSLRGVLPTVSVQVATLVEVSATPVFRAPERQDTIRLRASSVELTSCSDDSVSYHNFHIVVHLIDE